MTPQPERSSRPDRDDGTRVQSEPPATMEFSNDSTNPTFGSQMMGGGVPGYPFLSPPLAADEIGRLGEYRILKKLGEGGMGFVFRGEDPGLKRFIALKVMRPEVAAKPQAAERFLREGRAAAGLKSDHIITIYRVGEANGVPFLAMEFLEGLPLDEWIKAQKKPVQLPQALRVVRDTLRGLATAHDKGLIHRDIKPANLWLEKGTSRIKLLDFGLTRGNDADMQLTQEGAVVGTPAYMAPEQASGKPVDPRADLFSVGVVFYTLLAGKNPFARGSLMETLGAIGFESQPPILSVRPDVPKEYSDFLDRLLAKIPDGRPAHAKAALQELAAIEKKLTDTSRTAPTSALGVPLVAVPVPADAAPQVWGELENGPTEPMVRLPKADAAGPKAPANKKLLYGGGLFAFLALLGGIIIIITNKDGTKTKIEVPDDGTKVEVQKGGKTVASVGGKKETPKTATMDADRKAAEFVLANGGFVTIGEREFRSGATADLPAEPFKCLAINLAQATREINDAEADMLFKLDGLQWLHLNYPLSDQNLARLVKLPASQSIVTWENNGAAVTDAGLKHFRAFRGLKRLVLYDVRAPGAGLKDWAGWELEQLNIRTVTGFTDDNLMFLKDLPKLDNISLQGDSVTDVGVRRLAEVSTLRDVNLYSTKVTDAGIAALEKLPNINYLRVQFSGESTLTRECLKSVGRMKTLGCVVLDAPLGDADVKPLLALDGLGEVHLIVRNAEFTDAGLMTLAGIKLLHTLQVERSRVTPNGVRKFRAARPEVKIGGELLAKADPDRAAAEWAIGKGGIVHLANGTRVYDVKNLPAEAFQITVAAVPEGVTDADLDRVRHLTALVDVQFGGPITDAGVAKLATLPNVGNLHTLIILSPELTDETLASAAKFPAVSWLRVISPKITGRGLVHLKGHTLDGLDMRSWSIRDADLDQLRDLPKLKAISLLRTAITDDGLKAVARLGQITELVLQECPNVTDAGIKHLLPLRNLKFLDISRGETGGACTVAAFETVGKFTELNGFFARGIPTADADLKHLVGLQKLEQLHLNPAELTDTGLATLAKLPALKNLSSFKGSKVTAEGVKKFRAARPDVTVETDFDGDTDRKAAEWVISVGGVVHVDGGPELRAAADLPRERFTLTVVGMVGRPIKNEDLAVFGECRGLKHINLTDTAVTDVGLAHFSRNMSLGNIGLSNTKITDAGLAVFKNCKDLRHLYLSKTGITDAGLATVADREIVEELQVAETAVTDALLDRLKKCASLKHLDVKQTKVTAKGLADFHTAVPGCKVVHDGGVIEAKAAADRTAAEYVLSRRGGAVRTTAAPDRLIENAKDLPAGPFELTEIIWKDDGTTDADLDVFRDLRSLGVVDIRLGSVTDAGVEKLAGFPFAPKLGGLFLRSTGLTDKAFRTMVKFPAMTHLAIGGTDGITGSGIPHLAGTGIDYLMFDGCGKLADAEMVHLDKVPKLGSLAFHLCPITDAALKPVAKLKGLTSLRVAKCNNVTDAGIQQLEGLESLEWMNLSTSSFTPAVLRSVAKLKSLKAVVGFPAEPGFAKLSDADLNSLATSPALEQLDMSFAAITDAGLETLARIKTLKELNLKGSKVTATGVKKFKAALPACKVLSDFEK